MSNFKVGDLVYCPRHGTKVYTVEKNYNSNSTPLKVMTYDLKENGCFLGKSNVPQVLSATKENKELLEKLYDVEFEQVKTSSLKIIKSMLANGYKCVPCWVSDLDRKPNKQNSNALVTKYFDGFICLSGNTWKYATPIDTKSGKVIIGFNPKTGKIITE